MKLQRAAAIAILVGIGWFAHAQIGPSVSETEGLPQPPAFVEDARHAHETALVRARMVSIPELPDYDPAEILARPASSCRCCHETGGWSMPRSFLVATDTASRSPSRRTRTQAAVPVRRSRTVVRRHRPTIAHSSRAVTAYWQSGELVSTR